MTFEWHGLSEQFIPLNVRKWTPKSYLKRQNFIPDAKCVTSKNLRGWVYHPPLVARRLTLPFLFFSSFFSSPFFFLLVFIRIALFPFLLIFTLTMSPYVLHSVLCPNSCVSRSIGVGMSWPQDFGLEVV